MDYSSSHHRLSKAIGGVYPSPATSTLQISLPPSYASFETPPPPFADQVLLAFPPAPPASQFDHSPGADTILSTATHVLTTEATALSTLSRLYATSLRCRDGFVRAVEAIVRSQERGGKNIVVGVGKSGKIGDKLVASMNSMGLMSVFLNPVEALHGDLGIVRKVSRIALCLVSSPFVSAPFVSVRLPLSLFRLRFVSPLLRDGGRRRLELAGVLCAGAMARQGAVPRELGAGFTTLQRVMHLTLHHSAYLHSLIAALPRRCSALYAPVQLRAIRTFNSFVSSV